MSLAARSFGSCRSGAGALCRSMAPTTVSALPRPDRHRIAVFRAPALASFSEHADPHCAGERGCQIDHLIKLERGAAQPLDALDVVEPAAAQRRAGKFG